jgi:hypothetical protein
MAFRLLHQYSPSSVLRRVMSLSYFSKHKESDGKRYDAVNCVRMWLAGKSHLPKDLLVALHYLIPELKDETVGDSED